MAGMDPAEILTRRLQVQRLLGERLTEPTQVVELLGCVQAQECAHAFWSLGLRLNDARFANIRDAFDRGDFLRTHILRPTWHFVSPADIGWILAATSSRVQQINGSQYRQLDLDQHTLDRSAELIQELLADGNYATRAEIGQHLAAHQIVSQGQRLAYLVMNAELRGLICSGPMRGAQHTYAVLTERVGSQAARHVDDPVAELARRFFAGHGPAGLKDFTRWSSLTQAQARSGIAAVADQLEVIEVAGQTLYLGAGASTGNSGRGALDLAYLLPLYDELVLSYPQLNFAQPTDHPVASGQDRFIGTVVAGLQDIGVWRRSIHGGRVLVEVDLAPSAVRRWAEPVATATRRLAAFLGLELA